jgi:UDP-2,3-diacylglucosamine pyrophosphatase LpxH
VILLGDLFDGWVYPIETQPPKYDITANAPHIVDIMTNLRKLALGKKVIYVVGNHDMTLAEAQFENFRKTVLSGITFQDSIYYV